MVKKAKDETKVTEYKEWSEQKRKRGQKNPKYVTSQHATDVQEAEGGRDKHFQRHRPADRLLKHKAKDHETTED